MYDEQKVKINNISVNFTGFYWESGRKEEKRIQAKDIQEQKQIRSFVCQFLLELSFEIKKMPEFQPYIQGPLPMSSYVLFEDIKGVSQQLRGCLIQLEIDKVMTHYIDQGQIQVKHEDIYTLLPRDC